jgi:lycopene cyclase domain-containing protein
LEKYLYLTIDLTAFAVPFALSFNRKVGFSKKWKSAWPAIVVTAFVFVIWDYWFTNLRVWGFNAHYITGIYILNLPIEEVLFFISIPYACLFTYEVVNYFHRSEAPVNNGRRITIVLIVGLMAVGIWNIDRIYTAVIFISLSLFLIVLTGARQPYLGRFYFAFLFILIPFFIVNSVLTGTGLPAPVVWYHDLQILGMRIGTIPLEDTFYGMLLILMNVSIFERLQKRTAT